MLTRKIRYCLGPLDGVFAQLPPAVDSVYLVAFGATHRRYSGVWYARSILRQDMFDFVDYLKAKGT